MAATYLLDTNIVSYLVASNPAIVRRRFLRAGMPATAISSISEAELRFGLAMKPAAFRQRVAVEAFLASVTILPWDSQAARAYADLRAKQKAKGRMLSTEDLMIASAALSLNLTLVTSDRAFSFVDGLKSEDWTKA